METLLSMKFKELQVKYFTKYIEQLPFHRSKELKIIVIDNAGFHSLMKYNIPDNIRILRIPPYSPELNPSEKIWANIKQFYKNLVFESIEDVKNWLSDFVITKMNPTIVKSITHYIRYISAFNDKFII